MKFFFNSLLYLLVLFSFENSANSFSGNEIKEICKNEQRRLTCIKNLKFKKLNLLEGKRIEIPVIPLKK
tara:strand:+ start:417 stop:623 length:207 start_codon:yes stop_codon:yes gene_type:complete